jgi:hypothetical protein
VILKPHLHPGHKVALEIVLEQARLLPADDAAGKNASALPVFKKHTFDLATDVLLGETVVVAERNAPKQGKAPPKTLLLIITPQQVSPPPAQSIEQLHRENDELRQQVKELQSKVIDLQVQLAWLRHAATPEGSEKVNDETFLRRAYLDLLGIPPTAAEARKFLDDPDAEKRARLIDRLLASPKFGEDWGDHWKSSLSKSPPQRTNNAVAQASALSAAYDRLLMLTTKQKSLLAELGAKHPEVQKLNEEIAHIKSYLEELKAETAVAAEPMPPPTTDASLEPPALKQKLQALDIREAEINLKAARTAYERTQMLAKTGSGAISQQEVLAAATELERAEVALALIKVRGDRLKEQQLQVRLAEGLLRAAKVNLERVTQLVKSGQITQSELESARFEVEKAEVALERQKARLEALP